MNDMRTKNKALTLSLNQLTMAIIAAWPILWLLWGNTKLYYFGGPWAAIAILVIACLYLSLTMQRYRFRSANVISLQRYK